MHRSIVPWGSFGDIERFFEEPEGMLYPLTSMRRMEPAMNLYETDKDVVAEFNLPGIDPERINVSVKNQMLDVSGSMEEEKEEKEKGKGYWRKEIRRGSFERMVRLPTSVDEDKIDATYEKGVLKIMMPKTEMKKEGKQVKVKAK